MNFSSRILAAALLGGSLLAGTAAAQDHMAAPMIGAPKPQPIDTSYADNINAIKSTYRFLYEQEGRPRIAIFWNRKFDDQLSQWYTPSRTVDTRDDYWNGSGFTATQNRVDVEGRFDTRPQPGELVSFEFGSGLARTLLNSGTEIVDRDTIMRLTHGKAGEATTGVVVSDYQEVEMDALIDYADYLAEVLYAPGGSADGPITVMISIKEVRTGRLVSMFRSRVPALPEPATRTEWVVTGSGYARQEVPVEDVTAPAVADGIAVGTPEYLGWTVALQAMEALSGYWSS
jgi:hypothetical protein